MEFARDAELVTQLSAWIDTVFKRIEYVRTQCTNILEATSEPFERINILPSTRELLYSVAAQHLAEFVHTDGVGLIFQRELVAQSPALEWWIREGEQLRRQEFVNNPDSQLFYDYEQLEWFRGGFGAQARTIAGPYIDHLGVNDYVTTWTIPLMVHDKTVGVVGIDLKITTLETVLIPKLLKATNRHSALVNATGQVIVSTIPQFSSGALVETAPEGYTLLPLSVENLNMALLTEII